MRYLELMNKKNEYEINVKVKWFANSLEDARADFLDEVENPDSILFQTIAYDIKPLSPKEQ